MRNTNLNWRDMPGETDAAKRGEFCRRFPRSPEEIAAQKASSDRIMSGIVENLNNDFRDNEPMSVQNEISLQKEIITIKTLEEMIAELKASYALRPLSEADAAEHKANGKKLAQEMCSSIKAENLGNKSDASSVVNEIVPKPKKTILDIQRVNRAIEVAAIAHKDQFRKGTETPYISHPYAVGMLLAQAGCSEEVIIAGILHDTVEDTPLTLDDIKNGFGGHVAEIVAGCSEHDKELEWKERKQHTIDHLALASEEIKLVTCADKLHNVTCMLTDYAVYGETLWCRFNEGPYEQEWYFQSLAETLAAGDIKLHPLVELFREAVWKMFIKNWTKNRNQHSLYVGEDIEDALLEWVPVCTPDSTDVHFAKFMDSRNIISTSYEDEYGFDETTKYFINVKAIIEYLRNVAPQFLWKIKSKPGSHNRANQNEGASISVLREQYSDAEKLFEQIIRSGDLSVFKYPEDLYKNLYDEKRRLRNEIFELFESLNNLKNYVYGGYQKHLLNRNDKEDTSIRCLIKLLGNLFGTGKKLADIPINSDWPDSPDNDDFECPFSTEMWGAYGGSAMRFSDTQPKYENPFELIVKICGDLLHVLDHFKGKGPQQIAEAVRYWQFESSCPGGSGEIIRGVLMHLHDILESIQGIGHPELLLDNKFKQSKVADACQNNNSLPTHTSYGERAFWETSISLSFFLDGMTAPELTIFTSWWDYEELSHSPRFEFQAGYHGESTFAYLNLSEVIELHEHFRSHATEGWHNNFKRRDKRESFVSEIEAIDKILYETPGKYKQFKVYAVLADNVY